MTRAEWDPSWGEQPRISVDSPNHPVNANDGPIRISSTFHELMEDYRQAMFEFASAKEATEVERLYTNMEMRRRELVQYVSVIEKWHGALQEVTVKF